MQVFQLVTVMGIVSFSLVSCSVNQTAKNESANSVSKMSARDKAVAEGVFNRINSERTRAGKKDLQAHQGLNFLAQKQANFLSKNSKNGQASTSGSINRSRYANLRYNIENVTELTHSTGLDDAAPDIVNAWMSSSEHRRTLFQSWNRVGVGIAKGPYGRTYATVLVGFSSSGVPRSVLPTSFQ